jgi:WD40 repeat protein
MIVSGGWDNTVQIWDIRVGELVSVCLSVCVCVSVCVCYFITFYFIEFSDLFATLFLY